MRGKRVLKYDTRLLDAAKNFSILNAQEIVLFFLSFRIYPIVHIQLTYTTRLSIILQHRQRIILTSSSLKAIKVAYSPNCIFLPITSYSSIMRVQPMHYTRLACVTHSYSIRDLVRLVPSDFNI